jgi:hypothetical protein
MFVSGRFLSKPGSELYVRKYYANMYSAVANHNLLICSWLRIPPFPIAGENAFELLEAAFDLQEVPFTTV